MWFRLLAILALAAVAGCPGPKRPAGHGAGSGSGITTRPDGVVVGPDGQPVPTLRLPTNFTPTRYAAELTIDPAQPTFRGTITIEGTLAAETTLIWLNAESLTIHRAAAGTTELTTLAQPHDFLGLRAARPLPAGPITLTLEYEGVLSTTETYGAYAETLDGRPYAFATMEPLGARRVFPCVDEPGSKVPWQLTFVVPTDDVALANAPATSDTVEGDQRRIVLAESRPLPTYLVAFGVGPFVLTDAGTTRGGAPIRIATFPSRAGDTAWAAKVTPRLVEILEDWFGTPYPYEKLDLLPIPSTVGFGAMENAGLIQFRASRMLFDPKTSSEDDRKGFVHTAGHEIAHQWFGDSVTPAWWDDLWLNEAFATWIEEKVMAAFSPAWGLRVPVIVERSEALDLDGLVSARRVRQPIDRADDIESAFDAITYQKGSAVIRMFEHWIGPDDFQTGVRAYLAAHAHGTATADDFLAALDDASALDVTAAFRGFLEQPGEPRVGATLRCDGKKDPVVTLTQERWLPRGSTAPAGDAPLWQIPVCVAYGTPKKRTTTCTTLSTASAELRLEGDCPKWFLPNADGRGYYRMGLDAQALDDLLDDGWMQLGPDERVMVAGDIQAAVARGEHPLGAELDLVKLLLRDTDHNGVEIAVSFAEQAMDVASADARDQVRAWIRKVYGRRAQKLGFLPDKGDDADRERTRAAMVSLVTEVGRDKKLLDRAVELAKKWRELPEHIRPLVLSAASVASANVRAQLRDDAPKSTDDREANDIWNALGASDDAADAALALDLLLDPAVDLKPGRQLLYALAEHPETQPVAAAFLRDHWDALVARLPVEGSADIVDVLTAACDAAQRTDIETWAADHVASLPGGGRATAQALESMDQCVASRAAMGPELDAWLADR